MDAGCNGKTDAVPGAVIYEDKDRIQDQLDSELKQAG